MQLQLTAQKRQREAGIKAELMRHKSPQIKVVYFFEDLNEIMKPFEEEEILEQNGNIVKANEMVIVAALTIERLQVALKTELEMNRIFSKESIYQVPFYIMGFHVWTTTMIH